MISYFKDKDDKSKKKYKKYKMITTIIKPFDTIVIIATTTSSITLSLTGIGLTAIPISTALACGLSIGNKVIYEIIVNKYQNLQKNNMKEINKLLNLSIIYTENLYKRKYSIKMHIYLFVKFLLYTWMKQKLTLFYKYEHRNTINFFSHNKLKFNLDPRG